MKIFLSEEQIQSVLRNSYPFPRDHALFHVAFATGLRVGDLLALKREDVAPDGPVLAFLFVTMRKTGKTIERELPSACRAALRDYLHRREDPNPYLFISESNNSRHSMRPMNRSSFQRIVKQYLRGWFTAEELRGNACHVTRRSIAKLISDRAGRIEPASRFLGHTSIAATVAYLDMDQYGKQADEIVKGFPWNTRC